MTGNLKKSSQRTRNTLLLNGVVRCVEGCALNPLRTYISRFQPRRVRRQVRLTSVELFEQNLAFA